MCDAEPADHAANRAEASDPAAKSPEVDPAANIPEADHVAADLEWEVEHPRENALEVDQDEQKLEEGDSHNLAGVWLENPSKKERKAQKDKREEEKQNKNNVTFLFPVQYK